MEYLERKHQVSLAFLDGRHVPELAERRNEQFVELESKRFQQYFDTVEKHALTDEQRRAVLTFDDNVMTVAAAGSGKTSVLIAKAGYAVASGLFKPEQIVLLAFNRKAAGELEERLAERLKPRNEGADRIAVATFHSARRRLTPCR